MQRMSRRTESGIDTTVRIIDENSTLALVVSAMFYLRAARTLRKDLL